jgi:hypothetical protein
MVIRGQLKTKNPHENKGVQNESRVTLKKSYTLIKPFPKLVTIRWLRQIWSPSDSSHMVLENANKSIYSDQNS